MKEAAVLIGARIESEMSPKQRATFDLIASGPRGGVPLPFLAMLDAPALAEAIQSVGNVIRFQGALENRLREVAILAAAAAFGSGYEWNYHVKIATKLGITSGELRAIQNGTVSNLSEIEAACVGFVFSAVRDRRIDHQLLGLLVEKLDRVQATEIVAIAGYYPLLAMFLVAGDLDEPMDGKQFTGA